ncbi:hypothetical protein NDU88_007973 [Pleurodeles waltl]|uniref:Uncharacterized protein n=1 Tax=Pleurodeles waltl TaxID=8319 RepID=A0AAV7QNL8_PLEWA|nr:hypothetical protein NDU88_007973 [Pleurodeles waltl]
MCGLFHATRACQGSGSSGPGFPTRNDLAFRTNPNETVAGVAIASQFPGRRFSASWRLVSQETFCRECRNRVSISRETLVASASIS